ncbi:MAG: proprotein convertase P-domain-containing protein, partial [Verrucomicrobia bacterium]|nr:proprotein convertase P-domain-containing protein [Verrucomicrobiota bacterium]
MTTLTQSHLAACLALAAALLLTAAAHATVFSGISNQSTLDTRSGQLTLQPGDVPKALADNATTISTLAASGLVGAIAEVTVSLDLTHPATGELTVWLLSPLGTRARLLEAVGGTGANFTGTVFDDAAATAIGSGTPPFTGTFRPAELLSAVAGQNPNGTWTLEIRDGATGNSGTLNSWSIQFDLSLSTEKDILTFGLPGNPAAITGTTISLAVPYGTDLTSLAPAFTLSPGATCDHDSGTAYDFTNPVTYTVRAADLSTRDFTVTVNAWATNFFWTGGGADGLWNNPANWTPAGIPGPAGTAFIPTWASVLSANNTFFSSVNQGVLGVAPGTWLRLAGTITNSGTILLESGNSYVGVDNGLGNAMLTGGGVVQLAADSARIEAVLNANGTLTNQDNTIRGFGYINSNLYFVNNGTVNADVDGRYLYLSGPTSGTGAYTASNGGILGINSVVTGGIFSGPFSGGLVTGVNGTLIDS